MLHHGFPYLLAYGTSSLLAAQTKIWSCPLDQNTPLLSPCGNPVDSAIKHPWGPTTSHTILPAKMKDSKLNLLLSLLSLKPSEGPHSLNMKLEPLLDLEAHLPATCFSCSSSAGLLAMTSTHQAPSHLGVFIYFKQNNRHFIILTITN